MLKQFLKRELVQREPIQREATKQEPTRREAIPSASSRFAPLTLSMVLGLGLGWTIKILASGGAAVAMSTFAVSSPLEQERFSSPMVEVETDPAEPEFIRPPFTCPRAMDDLMPLLLRDLPSYANRVSTRAQVRDRSFNPRGVVLAAAQPEVDTLAVDGNGMIPSEEAIAANNLTPLFFTTLERHYRHDTPVRIQHYHWAFLSRHQGQWGLAIMFSRIGGYPARQPVSPPRESRQGTIGQGLQLWLRDCNAGSVDQ